jgi:hypothetical protein
LSTVRNAVRNLRKFPASLGKFPASLGKFPASLGKFPASLGKFPTNVLKFPTNVLRPPASEEMLTGNAANTVATAETPLSCLAMLFTISTLVLMKTRRSLRTGGRFLAFAIDA